MSGDVDVGTKLAVDVVEREKLTEAELIFVDGAIEAALRRVRFMRRDSVAITPIPLLMSKLTPREGEVVGLLVAGYPNKEVARRLNISSRTVEVHREHILTKLGVTTTIDLVNLMSIFG